MNNLVSTDLENLIDGRDFLLFLLVVVSHAMGIVRSFVDDNFPALYFPLDRSRRASGSCITFLERIRRDGRDDRPLPNPGHRAGKSKKYRRSP
jgi:hypothetical protein